MADLLLYFIQNVKQMPKERMYMDAIIEKGMVQLRKMPYFQTIQTKSKYALVDTTLTVIGAAFEVVSKMSPEMQAEIAGWNDGRKCGVGVLPNGPFITLQKKGDQIVYLGKGKQEADVTFLFKNLDSAVMLFTAQMSAHQAAAECRILIDGVNSFAMELNRALSIVETYLFPGIILNMIFKRPPKLTTKQQITKGRILAALMPNLVRQIVKSTFKG
jgi:hypothetical protein